MYRHLLVGIDRSASAQEALSHALEFAHLHQAMLTLLSVEEHLPHYAAVVGEVQEAEYGLREDLRQVQQAALAQAVAQGIAADTLIVAGSAAQTISRIAAAGGYDLIVIGAGRHKSLWNTLLGATADRVVETAPCSVLVVRHAPLNIWVSDIMQRAVATVRPETPVAAVIDLLVTHDIKAAPVVDGTGWVVGIITGGDLLERAKLPFRMSLRGQIEPRVWQEAFTSLAETDITAAEIMTADVTTVGERTPLREAARMMAQQHIKRLPVVDQHGQLVGLLSRLDVLRAIADRAATEQDEDGAPATGGQYVRDMFDPNVPTVLPETTLDIVVVKVIGTKFRRVIVVNSERHVVGIITDADLLNRLNGPAQTGLIEALRNHIPMLTIETASVLAGWQAQRAEQVMRHNPVVIAADAPILDAITLMVERRIKRIPVVDARGRLVGMVDRQALLRAVIQLP